MRYALHLVRTSRPKAKDAPESVKKYVAFGASVRAAQYLVLGAKARALTERPLSRELRRHPRAWRIRCCGTACSRTSAPSRKASRPTRSSTSCSNGGRRARDRECRARRQDRQACIGAMHMQHRRRDRDARRAVRRSEDPRADRQPRAAGADGRRRLHQRPAPRAVLRRVDRLRRASRLRRRATTSGAWTGGCTRGPTATTSSSTRPTPTPTSRVLLDVSKSMSFGSEGVTQARVRQLSRRVPRVPRARGSATASASSRSTARS